MPSQQNIPNTGQKTVNAYMKVKSFVSAESPTYTNNPSKEELIKFDQEITDFLSTIDNTKRFLNGRNSYAIGNKLYVLIWYLETIPDQPVTQPFGGAAQEVKIEEKKDEQNNSSETAKV